MDKVSTVSETIVKRGGDVADWCSLRLTTAFMLTLLQMHSVDPHHARIEKKMKGWDYSGRK